MKLRYLLPLLLLAGTPAFAQSGDREGEVQEMRVPKELIPPAPVLSPEEALQSFQIKPGFRIELVAAEPLISTPVAMEFDADGRIWVVEMNGYMPNADGTGEDQPNGNIVVLEDTDGDGRMDKRTVFLDKLVMPRAIGLVQGGVLVAEMPNLWFCRDTDGDFKCDEKTRIADDYIHGNIENPEHNSNGLMWGLDNWIYSANHTTRFRNTDGQWERSPTVFRGQWGMSQDNYGRQVYDTNSDQLRMDLVPAEYLQRNRNYDARAGVNFDPVRDQSVYPIRVTPGINRGYQPHMLEDGYLTRFTAACGPVAYRGDNFPSEFLGDVFVCEPSGNLIKRNDLYEENGVVDGEHAYEESEFLASTDERFRPVNAYNGPDGALYLVDMYRGLIQHRIYLTTYLREQVEDRGLAQPINHGRIYRVVHEGKPLNKAPQLSGADSTDLVKALAHPNGWVRDTAQRLLVERRDVSVVPAIRRLALTGGDHLARLHALWTLEGMDAADAPTLKQALKDDHPKIQVAAMRIADTKEALSGPMKKEIIGHVQQAGPEVHWQAALSLGNHKDAESLQTMVEIALRNSENHFIRDALLSGLGGRELDFLTRITRHDAAGQMSRGLNDLVHALASAVYKQGKPERVNALLSLAADLPAERRWQSDAVLEGIASHAPRPRRGQEPPAVKPFQLDAEPDGLATLREQAGADLEETLGYVDQLISWPGKAGGETQEVRPLTEEEKARFEQGKQLYAISCGACHQPHGKGQEGLAPPLIGSEWANGSPNRIIRITLHGLMGPIQVKGVEWNLIMPGLAVFNDEQLASILTYVRREWGNTGDPVTPEMVAKIRAMYPDREQLWTEEELLKIE